MVSRAPFGGRDPTPSPQPSFPRSAEPDQQESLGSAESRFAPGAPCWLIKGKKERKKQQKTLKPGTEILSEQQSSSRFKWRTRRDNNCTPASLCGDKRAPGNLPAPFNYESRQEAWITCALETGAGGGRGWGWVPRALA